MKILYKFSIIMEICKKDNADIIQYIKEKKEEITKKKKN